MLDKAFYSTLISKIVEALPGAWRVEDLGFAQAMKATHATDPDQQLLFEPNPHTQRLHISGSLGKYHQAHDWYTGPKLRMGVAATREPEAVARDIQRRLLPNYLAALAAARESHEQRLAAEERAQHLTLTLAAAIGGTVSVYNHTPYTFGGRLRAGEEPSAEGNVTAGSVSLTFKWLTPELAQQIIQGVRAAMLEPSPHTTRRN